MPYRLSSNFLIFIALFGALFFLIAISVMAAGNDCQVSYNQGKTWEEGGWKTNDVNRICHIFKKLPNPGQKASYPFEVAPLKELLPEEKKFDIPIMPFSETREGKKLGPETPTSDYRDAWGYPMQPNAYQKDTSSRSSQSTPKKQRRKVSVLAPEKVYASDVDSNVPGLVNCRATTSVTGYFKAYFEDVAVNNSQGYAHPIQGAARREEACRALQDIAAVIQLDQTTLTPDILFAVDPRNMPADALAAASAYFLAQGGSRHNGTLHEHIISRTDPTPQVGQFDAYVLTNFRNVVWDIDTPPAPASYDFYTVISHEIMHALGFRGLLPGNIISTNTEQFHGTFDYFSYKDPLLTDRFLNPLTEIVQVPVGSPSPWFVTGAVAYRGVKNITGATQDGVRPVYSPAVWEEGSSLSHFDMNRAVGKTYLMHPSITEGDERFIHEDEKEVLCHLGYQVAGMNGCTAPTPFAEDDYVTLTESTLSACIDMLANDVAFDNGILSLASLIPEIETGDTITYYDAPLCGGSVLGSYQGARSLRLVTAGSTMPRTMTYTVKDSVATRVSLPAKITVLTCNADGGEYVCNGGFEMTQKEIIPGFYCGASWDPFHDVPFWCQSIGSPDIFSYINRWYFPWTNKNFSCTNCTGGSMFATTFSTREDPLLSYGGGQMEGILTKLKHPLVTGDTYTLSFDVFVTSGMSGTGPITAATVIAEVDPVEKMTASHERSLVPVFDQTIVNTSVVFDKVPDAKVHVEESFVATKDHEFLSLRGDTTGTPYHMAIFNFDNVSLKKTSLPHQAKTLRKKICFPKIGGSWIHVLYPNKTESYKGGDFVEVRWETCHLPQTPVTISMNGTVLKSSTTNDGAEVVQLPLQPSLGFGNFYTITVTSDAGQWTDSSDRLFTIRQ